MSQHIVDIASVEAATKPSKASVTDNSISFDFQTEIPIVAGTEQYYKYLVQYRVKAVSSNRKWVESLPLIDHPDGVTVSRQALNHTINNLTVDTEYEVQVAVCRAWYGVRGECELASNPVVIITTSKSMTLIWKLVFR